MCSARINWTTRLARQNLSCQLMKRLGWLTPTLQLCTNISFKVTTVSTPWWILVIERLSSSDTCWATGVGWSPEQFPISRQSRDCRLTSPAHAPPTYYKTTNTVSSCLCSSWASHASQTDFSQWLLRAVRNEVWEFRWHHRTTFQCQIPHCLMQLWHFSKAESQHKIKLRIQPKLLRTKERVY